MALCAPWTVVGKSVPATTVAHTPRVTTRKFYNVAHLLNNEFQHEIANHYRDFKHKQQQQQQQQSINQLHRKRRRQIYVPYRRAPFYGVISGKKRMLLPTAVHNFPRFSAVYTPRGRQTLCEGAPPDETYNDTLRHIRRAHTCDELRVLVERQFRLRKRRRAVSGRKSDREQSNGGNSGELRKCEKCALKKSNSNNNVDVNADATTDDDAIELSCSVLQQTRQRARSEAGRWEGVAHTDKGSGQWHSESRADNITHAPSSSSEQRSCSNCGKKNANNSLEYCLQLASEYYEQRLLSNLLYLESIGARNAAQRQRLPDDANAKQPGPVLTLRSTPSSSSTADTTPASTAAPTPRLSTLDCFSLAHLVQLIGRKRSFRAGGVERARDSGECAIRVDITRASESTLVESVGSTARKRTNSRTPVGNQTLTGRRTTPGFVAVATQTSAGMHDYLNESAIAAPTTALATYTSTSAYNCGIDSIGAGAGRYGAASQTQFHELIDHLMQLEISDADASLPKITLTDCSTLSNGSYKDCGVRTQPTEAEVDSAVSLEIIDPHACVGSLTLHKYQQQQQRQGAFSLKQTKFNFHSSLELPDEPFYHSEARPP